MASSITKQFNMPPEILNGIGTIAANLNRRKSHVLGAAINQFASRPQEEIEIAMRNGSSEYPDTMERVSITMRKSVHSRLAGVAGELGRKKAELVRVASETFLQLSSREQEKAIIDYVK